ncbi:DUF6612 family protein [Cohnella sp. WQ 127256]|uniref:DUF6612 family protein n=1 Tax=Cohnella sp. WQ 127256 TaxID=2938790 RepID=UPI0021190E20|nr:DUF6612 family protein [Cohnella sp. WQ 127256]
MKYTKIMVLLFVLCFAIGCSKNAPVASPSATESANPALEWLAKAQTAAQKMEKYAFELQLNQKLSGTEEADRSDVEINMQGRVERNPLKLDQTIKSTIDGEASTLRAIVVPDAYYMYLPEYEEWSKLSKEVAADNVATLSDFQVNPEQALLEIQGLGKTLTAEQDGQVITVRYDGIGPEAANYLGGLLESTLGLSSEQSSILDSLEVQKLKVLVTLDAEHYWPLSYRVESDLTLELDPGKKTAIIETLAGTYSKHNISSAITVPKEALNALDPSEIDEQLKLE